ncbi:MAG TPA: hypothetical protein PKL48_11820 [Thermodesulfobacteriota bacterium]|nr:hypothetical protein [Thermodesulfobacteriota bacterium]
MAKKAMTIAGLILAGLMMATSLWASDVQIINVTTDLVTIPEVNQTFRLTMAAVGPEGVPLHYRFFYKLGYGTEAWNTNPWQLIQDWSPANYVDYTLPEPGTYYLVGHVVPAGKEWVDGDPQGGFSVTVNQQQGYLAPDVSGTWEVNVTEVGCFAYLTYDETAIITQNGSVLSIYWVGMQRTFTGTLNGLTMTAANLPISFPEDGGTTTITSFSVTFSPDGNSVIFNDTWTWTDGEGACSGTCAGSGTKD